MVTTAQTRWECCYPQNLVGLAVGVVPRLLAATIAIRISTVLTSVRSRPAIIFGRFIPNFLATILYTAIVPSTPIRSMPLEFALDDLRASHNSRLAHRTVTPEIHDHSQEFFPAISPQQSRQSRGPLAVRSRDQLARTAHWTGRSHTIGGTVSGSCDAREPDESAV